MEPASPGPASRCSSPAQPLRSGHRQKETGPLPKQQALGKDLRGKLEALQTAACLSCAELGAGRNTFCACCQVSSENNEGEDGVLQSGKLKRAWCAGPGKVMYAVARRPPPPPAESRHLETVWAPVRVLEWLLLFPKHLGRL